MKNGKLVATLGAVALVAAVGLGSTLAYLSASTGPVTNTFVMGNVSFNEDLKGGLVEHKVDTTTGKQLTGDKAEWVVENRYEKLTPGEEVDKDPTVFIGATSEDAWLFVTVTKSADYDAIDFSDEFVELGTVKDSENKEYTLLRSVAKVSAPEAGKVDAGHQVFSNVKVNKDIEFINNKLVYTVNGKKVEKDALDKIYVKAALVQYDGLEDEAGQAEALATAKKLLKVN